MKRTNDEIVYHTIKYLVIIGFTVLCVLPIIHVVGVSFMTNREAIGGTAKLWPTQGMTLAAYKTIMLSRNVRRGMGNSLYITLVGTSLNMMFTTTFAYALSKKGMPGHTLLNALVVFSMFIPIGLIPLYILVRSLGMINTYWAVMIPMLINPFWCILMRNFFEQLPPHLNESAYMEGASEFTIFLKILLPLSKPGMAAVSLFYAVAHWNEWFRALMYITNSKMWPIQVWLQQFVSMNSAAGVDMNSMALEAEMAPDVSIQMATIIVATLPILLLYPYLQKYFAKGILLGSAKG